MSPSRPATLLFTAVAVIAVAGMLARRGSEPPPAAVVEEGEQRPAPDACAAGDGACASGGEDAPVTLQADEVCPGAGYLCASIARGEEVRIIRWNDDARVLRIRVPAPAHEPPGRARALQQAAARGLRAWQGRPFPLRIDVSEIAGDHDMVIRWVDILEDRGLGRTRTRWTFRNGRGDVEVQDVVLATRAPGTGRGVTPDALELAAAHEMGHVLGLPHSDRERDVMYPENTATRPTSRDYRTLEALYRLANGAVIR